MRTHVHTIYIMQFLNWLYHNDYVVIQIGKDLRFPLGNLPLQKLVSLMKVWMTTTLLINTQHRTLLPLILGLGLV